MAAADAQVRRVRHAGTIKWRNDEVFIGEALAGELVGLSQHESGAYIVRFCGRDLGVIGHDGAFVRFAPPRARVRVVEADAAIEVEPEPVTG